MRKRRPGTLTPTFARVEARHVEPVRIPPSIPWLDDPVWSRSVSASATADLRSTAWHEAGHAVANLAAGISVESVVVDTNHWSMTGWTMSLPMALDPETETITWLAGMAGEAMGGNSAPWQNARTDIAKAHELASKAVGSFLAHEAVQQCWGATIIFMEREPVRWVVREIAAHAMLRGMLQREHLSAILDSLGCPLPHLSPPTWDQPGLPLPLPVRLAR